MKRIAEFVLLALCGVFIVGCSKSNNTPKTDSNTSATFTTSKQPGQSTIQEVYEFLKKCQTYYLATVEGDQPRVRPFGTVEILKENSISRLAK